MGLQKARNAFGVQEIWTNVFLPGIRGIPFSRKTHIFTAFQEKGVAGKDLGNRGPNCYILIYILKENKDPGVLILRIVIFKGIEEGPLFLGTSIQVTKRMRVPKVLRILEGQLEKLPRNVVGSTLSLQISLEVHGQLNTLGLQGWCVRSGWVAGTPFAPVLGHHGQDSSSRSTWTHLPPGISVLASIRFGAYVQKRP